VDAVKGMVRQEQARQTRRAVLAAAAELFVEQGWEATTIDQVAARAGVSRPTVFAVGSKADLLRLARDVVMAGDDEQLSVQQRDSAQRVLAEPDARRCLGLLAEHVTAMAERYGPLDRALRQAAGADSELAALWQASEEQRRSGAGLFVRDLAGKAALAGPQAQVVDVLWLLMAPDQHARLVHGRGWSRRRYVSWLTAALQALLLADGSAPRR
jgi:AcrR family transcriptional regulator